MLMLTVGIFANYFQGSTPLCACKKVAERRSSRPTASRSTLGCTPTNGRTNAMPQDARRPLTPSTGEPVRLHEMPPSGMSQGSCSSLGLARRSCVGKWLPETMIVSEMFKS